jgi:hypothetical protein
LTLDVYRDTSKREKARRKKKKRTEDQMNAYDVQTEQASNIKAEFNITMEKTGTTSYDEFTTDAMLRSQNKSWRELFFDIPKQLDKWKDTKPSKLPKLEKVYDYDCDRVAKPLPSKNVQRYVVCGEANGNKHIVLNMLSKKYGSPLSIAAPGINQVIRLEKIMVQHNEQKEVPSVMLYSVDEPYHYAHRFRGASRVDGVIFVIETDRFAQGYSDLYNRFHDIIGEYSRAKLNVWVIAFNAQDYSLSNATSSFSFSEYETMDYLIHPKDNAVLNMVGEVLRCHVILRCSWYYDASPKLSDSSSDGMLVVSDLCNTTLENGEDIREYAQSERRKYEPYTLIHVISSDEEESTKADHKTGRSITSTPTKLPPSKLKSPYQTTPYTIKPQRLSKTKTTNK